MTEYKLREGLAGKIDMAKIEILPPDGDFFAPPEQWGYRLDMDRAPDWYDAEREERRARIGLAQWLAARVFDARPAVLSGETRAWVRNSRAVLSDSSRAVLRDSSRAVLRDSSRAVLRDSSRAVLMDSSSADLWDSSRAVLRDSSLADLRDSSRAVLRGRATAKTTKVEQITDMHDEAV